MKKLSELAPKIVEKETGKAIPFAEFLEDQAGNGELYTPLIGQMLVAAHEPTTSWMEADDFLSPIAREIISEAVQMDDKIIYINLVTALRGAWEQLCKDHNSDGAIEQSLKLVHPSEDVHSDILLSIQSHYTTRLKDGEQLSPAEVEELLKIQETIMQRYMSTTDQASQAATKLLQDVQAEYRIMLEFLEKRNLVGEYDAFRTAHLNGQ